MAAEVISIRGDKEDPLSKGHLCPKGTALADIHSDPDRLHQPMRRRGGRDFFAHFLVRRLRLGGDLKSPPFERSTARMRSRCIWETPPSIILGPSSFRPFCEEALDSKNQYAATSLDQLPHHLAASQMFGHGLLIPVPDIDHTDHMVILGANPAASNGSLMTAPGMRDRLRAIRDRGGKVILIDPARNRVRKVGGPASFYLSRDGRLFVGGSAACFARRRLGETKPLLVSQERRKTLRIVPALGLRNWLLRIVGFQRKRSELWRTNLRAPRPPSSTDAWGFPRKPTAGFVTG